MNEKLEAFLNALELHAHNSGWQRRAIEHPQNIDTDREEKFTRALAKSEKLVGDYRAAIRELFQAKVYADDELIAKALAALEAAEQYGYERGCNDASEEPTTALMRISAKKAKQEADAAEAALREALGVQRD